MTAKKGFTLIELLVVIAIVGLLIAIVLPSLNRARLQAKILSTNSDLRQIALALECYQTEHRKYPPTREDCGSGSLKDHLFQLPAELTRGDYLPAKSPDEAMSVAMEDRFHPGRTYKYRSVGECIRDRDIIDKWTQSRLWTPNGFPAASSLETDKGQWHSDIETSPIKWVVFSVGPNFDEDWLLRTAANRYPVPKELWFAHTQRKGFLVRMRLKNGSEIGSFEGNP